MSGSTVEWCFPSMAMALTWARRFMTDILGAIGFGVLSLFLLWRLWGEEVKVRGEGLWR